MPSPTIRLADVSMTPAKPVAIFIPALSSARLAWDTHDGLTPLSLHRVPNQIMPSRSAPVTPGSVRQNSQLPRLTMAVTGPIESASARITVAANAGCLLSDRMAYRASCINDENHRPRDGAPGGGSSSGRETSE